MLDVSGNRVLLVIYHMQQGQKKKNTVVSGLQTYTVRGLLRTGDWTGPVELKGWRNKELDAKKIYQSVL